MKKSLFTITLLIFSFVSFSQSAFTKATMDEILEEYRSDSKAFFTNRLSDDFRYTTPQGTYLYRKDIIAGDAQKMIKTEIDDLTMFQSGDLVVVSGIHKTVRVGADGTPNEGKMACTYTFQRRNNKWMFVASHHTPITK